MIGFDKNGGGPLIFLFIGLPLVVAALLPLIGKLSKRFLPDLLANAVFLFLLVLAAHLRPADDQPGPRPEAAQLAGRSR